MKDIHGPKFCAITFLYVITQTLETLNVDLELDYLHLLKEDKIKDKIAAAMDSKDEQWNLQKESKEKGKKERKINLKGTGNLQ